MKDYLIKTVSHLQEAENKLYAASCRQDGDSLIQTAPNASRETDVCCPEGKARESVQGSSSPSQQLIRTPFLKKVESQNADQFQPTETETAEKNIVASLAEGVSAQDQDIRRESLMKKENGEHRLLMNPATEKKGCNRKDKPHGSSSVTEKSPEQAFPSAFTSSGEGILSGTLKDIYDRPVTNHFEQVKKAVVKESSKSVESKEHGRKMEDSKMETHNEICRKDLITFTSAAQRYDLTAVYPSMNDSEEVQKSRHWRSKE